MNYCRNLEGFFSSSIQLIHHLGHCAWAAEEEEGFPRHPPLAREWTASWPVEQICTWCSTHHMITKPMQIGWSCISCTHFHFQWMGGIKEIQDSTSINTCRGRWVGTYTSEWDKLAIKRWSSLGPLTRATELSVLMAIIWIGQCHGLSFISTSPNLSLSFLSDKRSNSPNLIHWIRFKWSLTNIAYFHVRLLIL